MRIIYHHRTQLADAQGVHICAMVRAFRELGHQVHIVSLVGPGEDQARRRPFRRIATDRLPSQIYEALSLAYNVYGYRQLARALRRGDVDLIYERYAPDTFCGVLASRRFGVPLLLEINAPWQDHLPSGEPPRFRRLARRLERWVCSNSSHTIAVTAALKGHLVELGVPERQVTVMHNAVDPMAFHPEVSGEEVRRRYRLSGHVVAGFVGWLRDWHGLADLIEAVHTSDLLERELRLLIVGVGPAYPQIDRRIKELGLAERVILAGAVGHADVAGHIAAFDLALQPRATEFACPMKLVEYMAMARCIVAPDQPNIRELLSDRVNARLFRPGDYGNLVSMVSELMSGPTERARLGRNARQSVLERNLLWRANAARTVGLIGHGRQEAHRRPERQEPPRLVDTGADPGSTAAPQQ